MGARPGAADGGRHLTDVAGRLFDRRIGRLGGDAGRAVSTTHAIAVFGLIITLSYTAFFITYDFTTFAGLVAMNLGFSILYVLVILLARLGRQLGAVLTMLTTAIVQLLTVTWWVGWEAGLHLYLLLAAQLVFLVFTDRQRALRWLYAAAALAAFLFAQFTMPASEGRGHMPEVLLNALLSVNAVLTAAMLFFLAAFGHFRGEQARAEAAENAARAEYLANTDALTGLATRRPVMERLELLSMPGGERYSLAIADLDHFKAINDTYGHAVGDRVLAEVGARLRGCLRVSDTVGRWGGEEFIFVLPEATLGDATIMMERVRSKVGAEPIACDGHELAITVSIGLTDGDYEGTADHAIRRADDALYQAKTAGRDRVSVVKASAPQPSEPRSRRRGS
ncbi:diguanylate cyclase [uncultured Demequina sp.]|uniref:GGDEF domain-containing protein n=1 Tax=uncultured Demequina sp. TaxID=693499 RepID=UPI0025F12CCE|nr:GGDEF domain-containing protein [uncultured Demequina sp.]